MRQSFKLSMLFLISLQICACNNSNNIGVDEPLINYDFQAEINTFDGSNLMIKPEDLSRIKTHLSKLYENNTSLWKSKDSLIQLWESLKLQGYEIHIDSAQVAYLNSIQNPQLDIALTYHYIHTATTCCYTIDSLKNEKTELLVAALIKTKNWDERKHMQTALCPTNIFISALRRGLARYQIYLNPNLKGASFPNPKDSTETYTAARKHLHLLYKNDSILTSDSSFLKALRQFQYVHGLEPDAKIGNYTRRALELSGRDRRNHITYSLKNLINDYTTDSVYLLVNIPSYQLFWVCKHTVDTFRVVVGRPETATEIFDAKMQNIVLSPEWYVPYSIASKEILPKLKKDTLYAGSKNYTIYMGNEKISPNNVDWSKYNEKNFPYRIVRSSGRTNDLGLIKFNFINPHSIYIHDTPSKSFFNRDVRAYSHGCIRVQHPFSLAEKILSYEGNQGIVSDTLYKNAAEGSKKVYPIQKHIPVHIRYYPVLANEKGELFFYTDIYKKVKDESLLTP